MRHIFDDSNETAYFCKWVTEKLNEKLEELATETGIEPIVGITPEMVEQVIAGYEHAD